MKLYIAGPMTGLPDLNFPAFHAMAATLRAVGHEVLSPAELCSDIQGQWLACMERDIAAMLTCEGIVLLPGWERSDGATVERIYAKRKGMCIFTADQFAEVPA